MGGKRERILTFMAFVVEYFLLREMRCKADVVLEFCGVGDKNSIRFPHLYQLIVPRRQCQKRKEPIKPGSPSLSSQSATSPMPKAERTYQAEPLISIIPQRHIANAGNGKNQPSSASHLIFPPDFPPRWRGSGCLRSRGLRRRGDLGRCG